MTSLKNNVHHQMHHQMHLVIYDEVKERGFDHNLLYFSVYKTILLCKIFRLKMKGRLIHGSKLRREQKSGGEIRDQSNPAAL